MRKLILLVLLLPLGSCMFHPPGTAKTGKGPYIDSIGYKAEQARVEMVAGESSGTLISEALAVQEDTLSDITQSSFFQSIEESYQRYIQLFIPVKKAPLPQVRCDYDLVETFNLQKFDSQPFINAMLHTMSLMDVTTIDFRVEPKDVDTLLIYVSLTKMATVEGTEKVEVSASDLILSVTRNHATLMTELP